MVLVVHETRVKALFRWTFAVGNFDDNKKIWGKTFHLTVLQATPEQAVGHPSSPSKTILQPASRLKKLMEGLLGSLEWGVGRKFPEGGPRLLGSCVCVDISIGSFRSKLLRILQTSKKSIQKRLHAEACPSSVSLSPSLQGSALFFQHGHNLQTSVFHMGMPVHGNVPKYVARINVMYNKAA